MTQPDFLQQRFPELAARIPRVSLASLPTPLREHSVDFASVPRRLSVKYDNLTGSPYGGNKVRKLEYLLPRARNRRCLRVATFGAAGSNHALATAIYARQLGLDCTCFLSHQPKTPLVGATLNKHLELGTELVHFGGSYRHRVRTLREHLWGRHAWVIPTGGSSWLGTVGFVAAGLELADQISGEEVPRPRRLYVGAGTLGTAVGIALGLALAEIDVEVHAVRVSDTAISNATALRQLLHKTAMMMRRHDASIPPDLAERASLRMRHSCFGPGYALGNEKTAEAVAFAKEQLDLALDETYTGKTMAALLLDWREHGEEHGRVLYWHTLNSAPLGVPRNGPIRPEALPPGFLRYFAN